MDQFHYPLDTEQLLRKKRRIRKELQAQLKNPLQKRSPFSAGPPPTKWRTSWACFCSITALKRSSINRNMAATGRMRCSARRSWMRSSRM